MDWITEAIAIGNRIEAHDPAHRERTGICSLISLDGSMTDDRALGIGYTDWACISMVDGPGNDLAPFRKVVQALIDMVEGSPPVLVHCHAGRSRSVTVVAAYLATTRGWSVQVAFEFIAAKRETAVQAGLAEMVNKFLSL
ncbi:MAG: dual specificity protein phosphatase [Proteobacteria bacterium]|nr:dual specificity protein phosphatase [Pseudomonadota bacterium]